MFLYRQPPPAASWWWVRPTSNDSGASSSTSTTSLSNSASSSRAPTYDCHGPVAPRLAFQNVRRCTAFRNASARR
jgi:hypothetical protein